MSIFLFVLRAPQNPTGSPEVAAAVNAWFERLGANLVARGNPALEQRTLGNGGTDTGPLGYMLVTADTLAAAVAMAEGCPALPRGGGVEVRELTPVNAGLRALA